VNARCAAIFTACLLGGTPSASAAQDVWESSFPLAAVTDRNVYFAARYFDISGMEHRQEVWREGSQRLRRITDGKLDLLIERDSSGEYQYRVADRTRSILILADRASLYRVGIFSDWKDVAHALSEPRGAYRVVAQDGPPAQVAVGPCSWSELRLGKPVAPTSRVCWSQEWGLPFEIDLRSEGLWETRFSVVEVRAFNSSEAVFAFDSTGLVELDTRPGEDISD
jgi:hypothetical protein